MIEGLISIRKPDVKSQDFYIHFYNSFSLIQVNDILLNELLDNISNETRQNLFKNIRTDGSDFDSIDVFIIGAGLYNPSIQKRKIENRSIDLSLALEMEKSNENSLKWYLSTNEFIHMYAIFEQALKDFLITKNIDPSTLKERTILNKLFEAIRLEKDFVLKEISNASAEVIEKQNEVIAIWQYFTELRNLYLHAGGRITDRFAKNMGNLKINLEKELNNIFCKHSLCIELIDYDTYSDFFIFEVKEDTIFSMSKHMLNFFRNFVVIIIEALDLQYQVN